MENTEMERLKRDLLDLKENKIELMDFEFDDNKMEQLICNIDSPEKYRLMFHFNTSYRDKRPLVEFISPNVLEHEDVVEGAIFIPNLLGSYSPRDGMLREICTDIINIIRSENLKKRKYDVVPIVVDEAYEVLNGLTGMMRIIMCRLCFIAITRKETRGKDKDAIIRLLFGLSQAHAEWRAHAFFLRGRGCEPISLVVVVPESREDLVMHMEGFPRKVRQVKRTPLILRVKRTDDVGSIRGRIAAETGILAEDMLVCCGDTVLADNGRTGKSYRLRENTTLTVRIREGSLMALARAVVGATGATAATATATTDSPTATAVPTVSSATSAAAAAGATGVSAAAAAAAAADILRAVKAEYAAERAAKAEDAAAAARDAYNTAASAAAKTGLPMLIRVVSMLGMVHVLVVSPAEEVESVKRKLAARTGVAVDQQWLVFAGRLLGDSRRIEDYNIQRDATLHLAYRLRP